MENQTRYYIIEHMEEFLFDWSVCEYIQIMRYLQNLTNIKLIYSNFNVCKQYNGEYNEKNQQNIKKLYQANSEIFNNKTIILQNKIKDYLETINDEQFFKFDDQIIPHKQACLLDLRAKQELNPCDKQIFRIYIIGGILGDHPPRDRTISLRETQYQLRHLGSQQMSTDTALLVSKLVIENDLNLQQIPFFDEPEIKGVNQDGHYTQIQMNGFKYVSDAMDPYTGKIVQQGKQPIIEKNIKEIYMLQDLDFNLM